MLFVCIDIYSVWAFSRWLNVAGDSRRQFVCRLREQQDGVSRSWLCPHERAHQLDERTNGKGTEGRLLGDVTTRQLSPHPAQHDTTQTQHKRHEKKRLIDSFLFLYHRYHHHRHRRRRRRRLSHGLCAVAGDVDVNIVVFLFKDELLLFYLCFFFLLKSLS